MAGENRLDLGQAWATVTVQTPESSDSAWDQFVAIHPEGHLAQTSQWAAIKSVIGWTSDRIEHTLNGQIVAGAQLLIHPIPYLGNVGYVVKGPLFNDKGKDLDDEYCMDLINLILHRAHQHHCQMLLIQPPNHGEKTVELLKKNYFKPSKLTPEPVSTLIVDLKEGNDKLLAKMKRQTRQNIRRSEKSGIQVREGGVADLDIFYHLHQLSSQRQQFYPYSREYIETIWRLLAPRGSAAMILAELDGEAVSALLLLCFGKTVFAHLLGWSGAYGEARPNDALFWGAIQWSASQGHEFFDFHGVDYEGALATLAGQELPEALHHSPDFIKYGFGGTVILYPPAFDLLPNPILNWFYRKTNPQIIGEHTLQSRLLSKLRSGLIRTE